jgi:hypothetical protein
MKYPETAIERKRSVSDKGRRMDSNGELLILNEENDAYDSRTPNK